MYVYHAMIDDQGLGIRVWLVPLWYMPFPNTQLLVIIARYTSFSHRVNMK